MEYSIAFTENCSPKLYEKLVECLKSGGLLCESVYDGKNAVYVGATFECLVTKVCTTGCRPFFVILSHNLISNDSPSYHSDYLFGSHVYEHIHTATFIQIQPDLIRTFKQVHSALAVRVCLF